MKRILNFFLSSKATIVLLFLSALAMAVATFIEDKYDTVSARSLIYNTIWFELLFLLLIINLFGHIISYKLFTLKKLGGFIFHIAFVVMILGAAITRYYGSEGTIHIRKGEASNIIYSSETSLLVSYQNGSETKTLDFPISFGAIHNNSFNASIPSEKQGNIEIKFKEIITNAIEKIEENTQDGKDIIELSVLTTNGLQSMFINEGELKNLGIINFTFKNSAENNSVKVIEKEGKLHITSPYEIIQSTMNDPLADTIKADSSTLFKESYIYTINGVKLYFAKFYHNAKKKLAPGEMGTSGVDAMILDITSNGKTTQAEVILSSDYSLDYTEYNINGTKLKFAFGNKPIEIPFSIYLKDFILEKYPGSESPSSYKSEVTLVDDQNNLKEDHSIFMNNVLDYKKYRFFQSSYDKDLQGTILSVNHDFWGTIVSYFGYFLMGLGFIITPFSKNSRFQALRKLSAEARNKRKAITTLLIFMFFSGIAFSQNSSAKIVDSKHAEKFGELLTQTYDGRIAPIHTLALDLMHKISKKEKFNIDGKGKLNAMQAFIDMMADAEFWQQQKIIYISQQGIKDILGITGNYASFTDFFDANSTYKLEKYLNESFRKKQSDKNKLDREILKVDERVNIFYMIINGSILKIFPEQNSSNHKWISWDDEGSKIPLTGAISLINNDLNLKVFNYSNLMQAYIMEVHNGMSTSDYSKAEKLITYITQIQKHFTDASILPSESKIKAEVFYNKANIFILLKNIYSVLSILLLILAFIENVRSKKSKYIALALNILTGFLVLAFAYHSLGMGLRWYITGHAPWANGYEALILVAWGALIAGFSFAKHSKLTLAATTLLAFLVLMTASLSSYDPQLTNLQPVLKSYWLIIHVATLTISYGFLGLGFILGIMNLFIYLSKTKDNNTRLDLLIAENTYIIEMNLIIGLFLATLGTFLGAVWANESWGRYWGWDAKETWALIITLTYSIIIHMRFIPKLKGIFTFNIASILGFSSVLMTFVGVNYYLSKGMHSYGAGDTPIFPLWAWGTIFAIIILIFVAGIKEKKNKLNSN